jgi:hypothetical protein
MKTPFFVVVSSFALLLPLCHAQVEVPEKYKSLYEQYESGLKRYIAYLDRNSANKKRGICFGAEILAANSNRGENLHQPLTLKTVGLTLDRFKELGIQGATVAIGYPILTDDVPNSMEYLDFYRKVAEMVRERHMKLCVKIHVLFSGTVFSTLKTDFSTLTIEKLQQGKRLMAERILAGVSPDYLTLGGEPDTEAKLTGLKELKNPETYAGMVRSILRDLKRGNTLVGVGQGTWVTPEFAKAFALLDIDFINLHVYPFGKRVLNVLDEVCVTARQHAKRLILDECWLYKAAGDEASGPAASATVFRRDYFSFWQPADELFLEAMAKVASENNIEYVSPFWSNCFFSYLKYDPSDEALSFPAMNRKFNQAVFKSMQSDAFSGTGHFYSDLIEKYSTDK